MKYHSDCAKVELLKRLRILILSTELGGYAWLFIRGRTGRQFLGSRGLARRIVAHFHRAMDYHVVEGTGYESTFEEE